MAVTRIKNNQITDSTITAQKIADGTLVGSLFSPDVTFNSNITITGNLAVTGNASSISATNTYVNDPLIVFNHGFVGSPSYDVGTIYNRNLSSLAPYGSVNAAWVWRESESAFAGLMTTETGSTLGSINNSGFANLIIGNVTAVSITVTGGISLTGTITAAGIVNTPISGSTGYFTTLYGANFSTGNAQISGGAITATPISGSTGHFTTLQGTNFSSSNVRISGGYISALTNATITTTNTTTLNAGTGTIATLNSTAGNVTTLVAGNFSTSNAQITGGSITGLLNVTANTLQATNFSTGNAQISGGAITATPISGSTGHFTTLQGTNFSSGNVRISGGYINGLANVQATIANFNTTTSTVVNSTAGNVTTLVAGNFSTANAVITGGYVNNLANVQATTANFNTTTTAQLNTNAANVSGPLFATNINTANAVITGGYINNLANISATNGTVTNLSSTTLVATNLSSGNIVSTGSTSGTWSTANVSLYSAVLPGTADQSNYVQFVDKTTGNVQLYTDSDFTYNPSTGVLSVPTVVTTGPQNFDTVYVQNFSTGNAVISGGYFTGIANISASVANFNTTTTGVLNSTAANITTGYVGNFSSGNVRISGGYINNLSNLSVTTATVTNLTTGNAQITGGSATGLQNLTATTAQATNFSSGNIVSTGSTSGTWSTANVSLYDNIQSTTANQLFYPQLVNKTSGNAASYVNSDLNYNPSTGYLTATRFVGTGYFTTLQATNFSTGNAVITGGYANNLANVTATNATLTTVQAQTITSTTVNSTNGNVTTLVAGNFSTANAQITGGTLSGLTNLSATTLVATNLSSGNVVLTGGYINNLANLSATNGTFTNLFAGNILATSGTITGLTNLTATTAQATNFSSGNAQITGGSLSGIVNLAATTLVASNLSSSNVVLTGGYINSLANLSTAYATVTNFNTGNAQITGGTITGLTNLTATTTQATNFSTGNAQITGGSLTGLTNVTATTLQATNFSSGNIRVSGGYLTGLANIAATFGTFTNLNTGNILVTGGTVTGLTNLTATTAQAANFSSGNARITGGYADNFPIGANTAATGNFTTLSASGLTTITNSTNSNEIDDGALVVAGGVGIGKDVHIGGNLYVGNIIAKVESTLVIQDPLVYLTANATYPYSYDIGFFSQFTGGPANVYSHTGVVRSHANGYWGFFSNVTEEPNSVNHWDEAGLIWDRIKAGDLILANTTPSTSTTTGALTVAGGAGIAGELYVGGAISAASASFASINNTPIGNTTPSTGAFTYLTATTGFSTANAQVTGGTIQGLTTLQSTNFSSGNILVTGGSATGLTNLTATTAQATNFSSGNAQITGGSLSGIVNLAATTAVATNFSSGNVRITGGYINGLANLSSTYGTVTNLFTSNILATSGTITGLTNLTATTAQATNFSSGNAQITGGSLSGITNIGVNTLQANNFSSGNVVVSGGYITGLANIAAVSGTYTNLFASNILATSGTITGLTNLTATTAQATNFSSGNAQITGGSATGLTNLTATTAQATNFSSGNVAVTGGYINSLANVTATTAGFGTTTSTVLNSTTGNVTTLIATNFSSGNIRVSGGYLTGLANVYATTAQATNFSSGNVLITGGTASGLSAVSATTLVATNFSTSNAQITGGTILAPTISGTVATANVSLYQDVELQTGSGTYYPAFYDKLTGNAAAYTNDLFSFNPATGVLSVPSISTTSGSGGSQSFNVLQANNFSSGNAVITGGYLNGLANVYATLGQFTDLSTGNILVTGGTVTGLTDLTATTVQATNFSSGNIVSTGSTSGTWSTANVSLYDNVQSSTANATFYPQFVDKTSGNAAAYVNSSLNFNPSTGYLSATRFVGTGYFTTLQATNFSSGNIRITGGYISSLTNATITTTNTTTLNAGTGTIATLNSTAGNVTTLVSTNFSSGNVQITGGKLLTMSNVESAGGIIDNLGSTTFFANTSRASDLIVYGNATVSQADVNSLTANSVTFSGTTFGTVTTANVALYTTVQTNNTNAVFYPTFVDTLSGNLRNYADGDLYYNPATGVLNAAEFSGAGILSNLTVSTNTTFSGPVVNDSNIASTSTSTGALVIHGSGGIGVSGNINVGGTVTAGNLQSQIVGTATTQLNGVIQNSSQINITTIGTLTGLTANGNIVAASTTNSTAPNNGSIVTLGGVGIAGNITSNAGAVFNYSQLSGQDFLVRGVNDDTLLWARPGTSGYDTVVIGGDTTTANLVTGAKLIINSTDAMVIPSGTTVQRPSAVGGTDVAGMLRFNSTSGSIEWYNGAGWSTAGTIFTVVVSQQFNGDDVITQFTLSQTATTASVIVSINGIVQIPGTAYSVVGTTMTFTQAPATGDIIDVRLLTTSQDVGGILSANGRMGFGADDVSAYVLTGTSTASVTTYWEPTGGKVSSLGNVTISTANTPTMIDTYHAGVYRTGKYVIQVTSGGNYQSQESLVVTNGTDAFITTYGIVNTGANLGVVSAAVTGSNVVVYFTSVNSGANVRISKDYIII